MIKKFIQRLLGQGGPSAEASVANPVANPADKASSKAADKAGRKAVDKSGKHAVTNTAAPAMPKGARVEVPVAEHRINPDLLDANAIRVVKGLKDAGFEAYVVGGAVRDLLVGMRPKDFDVATNATPEQVKGLFRRAFIIGRRFRIVHVVFGRGREHETIEVSTFRAYMDAAAAEQVGGNEKTSAKQIADRSMGDKSHVVDASGRVLRDNVWGPQIEDAARRDFTVNALYYDPLTQMVVDYHGGLADGRAKTLRMIGDPETRYREDPVRIIRVVRFAAKLGFALDPQTERPLRAMVPLLGNVPPSRLFDEMVKLLQTGHALASIEQLKRFALVGAATPGPFPVLEAALGPAPAAAQRDEFVRRALQDTDLRVAEGRAVAPSFMLACMLWHDVQQRWAAIRATGLGPTPALQQAVDAVFDARIGDISGRGKLAADMREIWLMQPRFERRTTASAHGLAGQARFRAGYDFLRLRAEVGELGASGVELADWWEDFHLGNEEERMALLEDVRASQAQNKGRRAAGAVDANNTNKNASLDIDLGEHANETDEADAETDEAEKNEGQADSTSAGRAGAPRKRRRRRRRPGEGSTGGGGHNSGGSSGGNSGGNSGA